MTQTTSRQRDTSKKRRAIISAAIEVFAEEGFENASMERIAERANAVKRTLYNHFASKEELLQVATAQLIADVQAMKQIPFDATRPLEVQLAAFADALLYLVNTPTRLGISRILNTMFIQNPDMAEASRNAAAAAMDPLETWIRAGVAAGHLDVPDPNLASRVFYAMIEGALTYPALQCCVDPTLIEPLKQEFIQTFLSRYAARPRQP